MTSILWKVTYREKIDGADQYDLIEGSSYFDALHKFHKKNKTQNGKIFYIVSIKVFTYLKENHDKRNES